MVAISSSQSRLAEKLQLAAVAYDMANKDDFTPLMELSERTIFESIDVHGDSAVVDGIVILLLASTAYAAALNLWQR